MTFVNQLDYLLEYIIVKLFILILQSLLIAYFRVGVGFKRLMSKTPYLIHDTTEAPHITG